MKTARRIITLVLFIVFLLSVFVTVVILPKDESSVAKENRNLATFPEVTWNSIATAKFPTEFEKYLSDNVGYRSVFTGIAGDYKNSTGINKFGKIVESQGDLGTGTTTKSQLLVTDNKVMEIYRANRKAQDEYIDMVNSYAKKMPKTINMYSMIMPTQIDFLSFYNTVSDSEKENIDYFYDNFDERVKGINVYETLNEQYNNGEYVYFRTDHHWTSLGAYYAYNKMSEDMNFMPMNIENFEKFEVPDFKGYLFSQAQSSGLENHKDVIEYYKNDINDIFFDAVTYSVHGTEPFIYTGKVFNPELGAIYTLFMGGDQPYIEINSNSPNEKTLMILKDSYSNALIPWLICSYNKVIVIDARTFDQTISKVLDATPIDDFLITNYILGTNFTDYIDLCNKIY